MNIQQVIIEGLRRQLYHHQFIVLPGFGGFVLKSSPAFFSATGLMLHPPAKTVTFNAQLRQNDGILTAWLQNRQGVSPAEALNQLNDFASYCRSVLENRRRLTLPGIGFFHLDLENNLGFEPQPDQNFLTASFGLTPISLPSAAGLQPASGRKAVFEDRRIILPETEKRTSARLRRVATPLLLAGVMLTMLLLLVSVSTFRGELRAALAGPSLQQQYKAANYEPLNLRHADQSAVVTMENGVQHLRLGSGSLPVKVHVQSRYQIVLGCFSKEANAAKLVRQLKRQNVAARISGQNEKGLTIVSYGAYPDRESALGDLVAMQVLVPSAWIKDN